MKRLFLPALFIGLVLESAVFAQSSETLISYMTPIDGWAVNRDLIEVFHEDNLYERINGASPGYFAYRFEEMTSVDYQKGDTYITIQAYRHASRKDAFGIYSAERDPNAEFLPIGIECYRDGSILNFLSGNVYVKIQSPSTEPEVIQAIEKIAANLADRISKDRSLPKVIAALPKAGKKAHSDQYISTKFMGHDFLHDAFLATYATDDGKTYKLFIIEGDTRDDIEKILTDYYAFTKQEDRPAEGRCIARDRYNGDVMMQWKGRYLWGIQNDWELPLDQDALLLSVEKGLKKQKMFKKK